MRIIWEKEIEIGDEISGTSKVYQECSEEEATHKHTCYNDEILNKPCKREKL